jgi:hypothetical protein
VGYNVGTVEDTYATGAVSGVSGAYIGGLIGYEISPASVNASYSTGAPTGSSSTIGGFIGVDGNSGGISSAYWDTTTSGITNLSQGAGSPSNDSGIAGLTTTQLQSGLPSGFSSTAWAQSSTINGGLPYLEDIPPS